MVADPNLPEDQTTLIHVTCPQGTSMPAPYASVYPVTAGNYSYRLYLPPGYYEHPTFHYPALFIMSPEGNATLGTFQARAHDEGWIAVMFVEAKNGDWGPIFGDMLATHADVTSKVRIQDGLKFATGLSGGARATSILTQACPGFNGELLQAAGFAADQKYQVEGIPTDHPYAVFMTMGLNDSNFHEINDLKASLNGVPFRSATFDGGHEPAPLREFNEGLDWLMIQALSGDSIPDGLKDCAVRQFSFIAKRLENDTVNRQQSDDIKALVAIGENLNFPGGSPEAAELKKLKDSIPLTP